MTHIMCNQQNCTLNKKGICTKDVINFLYLPEAPVHFFFACMVYKKEENHKKPIEGGEGYWWTPRKGSDQKL